MHKLIAVLMIVGSVSGSAQTARVVPVDLPTASNLAILAKKAKDAQQAYDAAVKEAQRRLLTTRDRKLSSNCFAFREGEGDGSITGSTFSGTTSILSISGGYDPRCETAEEKKVRSQRESEYHTQQAKWDAEHPERYWLEGFCEGAQFTDDFRYMVPKPLPEVHPTSPFTWGGTTMATPLIGIAQ